MHVVAATSPDVLIGLERQEPETPPYTRPTLLITLKPYVHMPYTEDIYQTINRTVDFCYTK